MGTEKKQSKQREESATQLGQAIPDFGSLEALKAYATWLGKKPTRELAMFYLYGENQGWIEEPIPEWVDSLPSEEDPSE